MEMYGHVWKCKEMYGTCMEMYGHVWKRMEMYGNVSKCVQHFKEMYGHMHGNALTCMEMYENVWKCMKLMETYGCGNVYKM